MSFEIWIIIELLSLAASKLFLYRKLDTLCRVINVPFLTWHFEYRNNYHNAGT